MAVELRLASDRATLSDPGKVIIYDFLPDALLDKVVNLGEISGRPLHSQVVSNADTRQSIFFRAITPMVAAEQRARASHRLVALRDGPRLHIQRSALEASRFAATGAVLPAERLSARARLERLSPGWIACTFSRRNSDTAQKQIRPIARRGRRRVRPCSKSSYRGGADFRSDPRFARRTAWIHCGMEIANLILRRFSGAACDTV